MTHPPLALIRAKYNFIQSVLRRHYFKSLGLQIKSGGFMGKITCEWPKNVSIGKDCIIQDGVDFRIGSPFSADNVIDIGDRVFIGRCCEINCTIKITIGDDSMIGSNTTIVDADHEGKKELTINVQPMIQKEIIIGKDVGIGTGCLILNGVTIGDGSVIGAGSIVHKSIPPYQIWTGSPARFVRNRN